MMPVLINHLWQSTLFAIAAGLLTLVFRKDAARVRYWIWLSASVKFLVPFSLAMALGGDIKLASAARHVAPQIVGPALAVTQLSQPVPEGMTMNWTFIAVGVWAGGFLALAVMRVRGWRRIRAAIRASTPMDVACAVEVCSSPTFMEPAVIGVFRPILILPANINQLLMPAEFDSIIRHELCHVRRRDNLTSGIHMVVEALFWFHPLIWWIGARLIEERERACDEDVLRSNTEPQVYVDAILKVCASYLEPPLSSAAGITSSDLKRRIEAIRSGRIPASLNFAKKAILTAAGMAVVAAPVLIGMLNAVSFQMQAQAAVSHRADAPAVSPPPGGSTECAGDCLDGLGVVTAYTVTVEPRVNGQLMSVNFKEGDVVQAGQLLATIDSRPYEIQLTQAEGLYTVAETQSYGTVEEHDARMKVAQANLNKAKLELSYTQVTAPITGVTGLRLIDPGNLVHGEPNGSAIVTITQTQPIAVLISVAEDLVPRVLRRLARGGTVPVEAFNRAFTRKLATGRLVAVDNQIDDKSGDVKLKAVFDNKNGALYPNQFVNVRVMLGRE